MMTQKRDIIVLGGSAGSLEGLRAAIQGLPHDFSGVACVVLHLAARGPSALDKLLWRWNSLPASFPQSDQPVRSGHIYIAPPDRHLIIGRDHVHLSRGPREGLHRPSINVTFRSAAAAYRERVVGVLFSGLLDDGAAGLWEIARRGGVTIIQDLSEARFPSMPSAALGATPLNYQLRSEEMGPMLAKLASGTEIPQMQHPLPKTEQSDTFSGFTCPECRGPLYRSSGTPVEFRCRVGHVFGLESLVEDSLSTRERKMYEAIVALEEGADLAEFVARKQPNRNGTLRSEAAQLRKQASEIRRLIESQK